MAEQMRFQRLGTMADCSRNGVMKPETVMQWIDLTSDLGYNTVSLYIEDTYEINDNPYFGHLRGRYSFDEMKAIGDHARDKGVEVIPCIQTLAHLNAIFHWPEYTKIQDVGAIMLVGDERVYALVDKMFASLKESLNCTTVNIGMDEAWLLGRGNYLTQNGLVDRFDILLGHLNRVSEIARKYDFHLLMWADMFFRIINNGDYYNAEKLSLVTDAVKKMIPDNVDLVYWDYYTTEKEKYDHLLEAHLAIKPDVAFAGGLWSWEGFAPHNSFTINCTGKALRSCLDHGVKDVYMTMWGDNGAECSKFSLLPSLYYTACVARGIEDMDRIKAGFQEKFGIPFDAFMLLDLTGTANDSPDKIYNPDKYMLYNDCFMGQFDSTVRPGDAESYTACAEKLAAWESEPNFGYLFRSAKALCQVLGTKFDLGIRTRNAYLSRDMDGLKALIGEYQKLLSQLEVFYGAFRTQWMKENKPHGFDVQDVRLGGLMQRVKHCTERLNAYVQGETDRIEELEEPVLDPLCRNDILATGPICYNNWSMTVTTNVI